MYTKAGLIRVDEITLLPSACESPPNGHLAHSPSFQLTCAGAHMNTVRGRVFMDHGYMLLADLPSIICVTVLTTAMLCFVVISIR